MATRLDYRNDMKDKVLGLENEGYGDFEYTDSEWNTYLSLAVSRLFPALYQRKSVNNQTVVGYGTSGYLGYVSVPFPERVFLIEDATEMDTLFEWKVRPDKVINLNLSDHPVVNVYYYDAYTLPADDVTDAAIPGVWTPLVVLGALIEALEARHDTGVRPDPSEGHQETVLIDRLARRYDELKTELAMAMPTVAL